MPEPFLTLSTDGPDARCVPPRPVGSGDNDEHTYRYTDAQLQTYAEALHGFRGRGLDVYAFVLSDDARAAMPQCARRLKELVHRCAGETVPAAPKAAGRSIASFFGGGGSGGGGGAGPSSKRQRT